MTAGEENSYVFFVDDQANSGSSMRILSQGVVKLAANLAEIDGNLYSYVNNDVVFTLDTQLFYRITRTGDQASRTAVTGYSWRLGRYNIKFQYRHNAPADRRIDPSPSNIIDLYILEKNYADDYSAWVDAEKKKAAAT